MQSIKSVIDKCGYWVERARKCDISRGMREYVDNVDTSMRKLREEYTKAESWDQDEAEERKIEILKSTRNLISYLAGYDEGAKSICEQKDELTVLAEQYRYLYTCTELEYYLNLASQVEDLRDNLFFANDLVMVEMRIADIERAAKAISNGIY